MKKVDFWECPDCGHEEDADMPHVPERQYTEEADEKSPYYCSHCSVHGWGENEMNAVFEADND